MFPYLEQILTYYAGHIHLAIFAPAVSFFDELIPPIPSPSVMFATGSIALTQGYTILGLFFLALLGAVGKTLGAAIVYYVADKLEDILAKKIAKFLGVTHEQIESLGAKIKGGIKDYFIMISLRALPIIPSSPISFGSGLLKISFKLFIISTFIGSVIRDFIFIYLGYIGTRVVFSFLKNTVPTAELIIQIVVGSSVLLVLGFLYFRQRKINKNKKINII